MSERESRSFGRARGRGERRTQSPGGERDDGEDDRAHRASAVTHRHVGRGRQLRGDDHGGDPVGNDSVGLALLVVLDTLTPAERLAFVLHDMFSVPFEQIAPIVDRSPNAAKMLPSRSRRRVRGRPRSPPTPISPASGRSCSRLPRRLTRR